MATLESNSTNANEDDRTSDLQVSHANSAITATNLSGHELWSRTPRPRGRQVKDPLAQTIQFQCQSGHELETKLREYIANPTHDAEHTTLEFTFPSSAAFMVHTTGSGSARLTLLESLNKTAMSLVEALTPTADPKEQKRKQNAIARGVVDAVHAADGYRYSFHNYWTSKEDQAARFSYFCNDSVLNKGRAANEGANSAGKKIRKPVYNCQGLLSVRFSTTKQNVQVLYKHVPIHQTFEERAPPPRKDSKRRKMMEIFSPEKLPSQKTREQTKSRASRGTRSATRVVPTRVGSSLEESNKDGTLQSDVHSDSIALDQTPILLADGDVDVDDSLANVESNASNTNPQLFRGSDDSFTRPQTQMTPPPGASTAVPPREPPRRSTRNNATSNQTSQPSAMPTEMISNSNLDQASGGRSTSEAEPAAAIDPIAEIQALKLKLLEAEKRIQSLEAARNQPQYPPPSGWPTQPPPPPGYHQGTYPAYPPPWPPNFSASPPSNQWSQPPAEADPHQRFIPHQPVQKRRT